jgi:hypothetical protein
LDFVGCAGIAGDIAVQTDKARPLVPADYPLDPLTPIATLIGMEWMTCESVAVGNTTVAKGITFAELQIVVTPPKDVQGPGLNLYLPEFILSAGPVLDLLNQFGFEAQDGTASCTSTQATLTCSLTAAGLRYDLTQAGDVDPNGVSVEETVRMHHEAGRHAWFNETKGGPEAQYSSPGTVTASGGRLAQLLAGNPGVFAGQVTSNKSLHLELNTT